MNLRIGVKPISNEIVIGNVCKGNIWGESREVTVEALLATVEHVLRFGRPVIISKADGTPEFKIIVETL